MLLKTLILKNNKTAFYKIHQFKNKLITQKYRGTNWLLNDIFSYLYTIYYNQYPHKRSIINNSIYNSVSNFLISFNNCAKKEIYFKNKIICESHNSKEDHITLDVKKSLKGFYKYNLQNFINGLNYYSTNISYIENTEFSKFLDDIDNNFINTVFYLEKTYGHNYRFYNIETTKFDLFEFYNKILLELNLGNLIKNYEVITNKINKNKKLDFKDIAFKLEKIFKQYEIDRYDVIKTSNNKKGIILVKKLGRPIYMDLNGNMEQLDKNNVNKYLNYEVISEINSKHGLYIYTHIIYDFISFKGYNL